MFSLSKIVALAAILAAVWYGFRLIGRLDEARKRKADQAVRSGGGQPPPRRAEERRDEAEDGVLDLVKDERGNYVARNDRDERV